MQTENSIQPFQQTPNAVNHDFEVSSLDKSNADINKPHARISSNLKYAVAGLLFGILLVKAEVISWFRIQEMFRLQSFHMYGVIGSAVITGIISIWLIKRFSISKPSAGKHCSSQ